MPNRILKDPFSYMLFFLKAHPAKSGTQTTRFFTFYHQWAQTIEKNDYLLLRPTG